MCIIYIMENPVTMHDWGVPPILGNIHILNGRLCIAMLDYWRAQLGDSSHQIDIILPQVRILVEIRTYMICTRVTRTCRRILVTCSLIWFFVVQVVTSPPGLPPESSCVLQQWYLYLPHPASIWYTLHGGFLKWGYRQIIHFSRSFHDINHPQR